MAMGRRAEQRQAQEEFWIAHTQWPRTVAHPFYQRLNQLLEERGFDEFVEGQCERFYAEAMGRPSLTPGRYFRLLLIGYFEGIEGERGIAWRAADSLALRQFLELGLTEPPPDHSTISRTRRLIAVETHQAIFRWVLELLAEKGLLKGKTVGIDGTTLEANAAMRSIVRRDTGEGYEEFLRRLAEESGIATPTREQFAEVACATNNEEVGERVHPEGPIEAVTDKGYHSNDTLTALQQAKVRSYVSEPDRGRRRWQDKPEARQAVYDNRRRIHGEHGKQLLRYRGEFLERSFAHAYETGGMRRVYLRGQANVLKRVLIHLGGFNLSLIMRRRFGKGTPRGWQGYSTAALLMGLQFWIAILVRVAQESTSPQMLRSSPVVRVTIVVRFAAQ